MTRIACRSQADVPTVKKALAEAQKLVNKTLINIKTARAEFNKCNSYTLVPQLFVKHMIYNQHTVIHQVVRMRNHTIEL